MRAPAETSGAAETPLFIAARHRAPLGAFLGPLPGFGSAGQAFRATPLEDSRIPRSFDWSAGLSLPSAFFVKVDRFRFRAVDPEVIDGCKEDRHQQDCGWPVAKSAFI